MADAAKRTPDGTDGASYAWLSGLDRSGWAWEWLRRDPRYVGSSVASSVTSAPRLLPAGRGDPERGLLFR